MFSYNILLLGRGNDKLHYELPRTLCKSSKDYSTDYMHHRQDLHSLPCLKVCPVLFNLGFQQVHRCKVIYATPFLASLISNKGYLNQC